MNKMNIDWTSLNHVRYFQLHLNLLVKYHKEDEVLKFLDSFDSITETERILHILTAKPCRRISLFVSGQNCEHFIMRLDEKRNVLYI